MTTRTSSSSSLWPVVQSVFKCEPWIIFSLESIHLILLLLFVSSSLLHNSTFESSCSTDLDEGQSRKWILLTGDHDDGIAGGDRCPKDCYHGEKGIRVREDEPDDSQGFRERVSTARPRHRLRIGTRHDVKALRSFET